MKNKLLYLFHEIFLEHETREHPENKNRLISINKALADFDQKDKIEQVSPRMATKEEISLAHDPNYMDRIADTISKSMMFLDSMDTVISPKSLDAALYAAGAGLTAADKIMSGDFDRAFCAVRPPGHHAEYDHAMGFCLFNNVALTARYLQQKHGIKKVLILDYDVHHGNGTEHCFYSDSSVYYISLHQYPNFPGTGLDSEKGQGEGEGFNLNIPLPAGTGNEKFMEQMENKVIPTINDFAPEVILLSSGFDAHQMDPLAGLNLTSNSYKEIIKLIVENSVSAEGRIISFLEGGYDLDALAESVICHLEALMA